MKTKRIIAGMLIGGLIGVGLEVVNIYLTYLMPPFFVLLPLGFIIGGLIGALDKKSPSTPNQGKLNNLPECAGEFIRLVITKMQYRKKVRADVANELIAHFEDELRDCGNDEEKEQRTQQLITDFGDVELLGVLLRRAKKRCRPLWRTVAARTFQAIGILILLFILYLVWFLTGKPNINIDYVAELNRLVRPVDDEGLNAAPYYEKAIELIVKMPKDLDKITDKSFKELTAEEKQKIIEWVKANDKALEQMALGNKKPYYWRTYKSESGAVIEILAPGLGELRELIYALRWRAVFKAEDGRYRKSFEDIELVYRVGRHIKGDGFLIEQLAGIVTKRIATHSLREILSEHEIDSALLAEVHNVFGKFVSSDDFIVSVRDEKFFMYDEIQRCFTGERLGGLRGGALCMEGIQRLIGLGDFFDASWRTPLHILFTHPGKKESIEMADNYWAFWKRMTYKTPAQIHAEGIDFNKHTKELIGGNILLEILTPALTRVIEIGYQNKVDAEGTVAVIAILRYEKETGRLPENLDELVEADLLKQVPMDPYSDGALVYGKTDDGFTLYSVGRNFSDDGGRAGYDKGREDKVKMWGYEGDAVFWPVE